MVERYAKVMPDAYRAEAVAWLAREPLPAPGKAPAAARKPGGSPPEKMHAERA